MCVCEATLTATHMLVKTYKWGDAQKHHKWGDTI